MSSSAASPASHFSRRLNCRRNECQQLTTCSTGLYAKKGVYSNWTRYDQTVAAMRHAGVRFYGMLGLSNW